MTADALRGPWFTVRDGDPRLVALYGRHYSANPTTPAAARRIHGVSGVGESICLLTVTADAGFIWVRNTTERYDKQAGVQCSFFRNEGLLLSSILVQEASLLAWCRWPAARLWTYVDPHRTRHKRDPGRCFRKAGWAPCGWSKAGLLILEKLP